MITLARPAGGLERPTRCREFSEIWQDSVADRVRFSGHSPAGIRPGSHPDTDVDTEEFDGLATTARSSAARNTFRAPTTGPASILLCAPSVEQEARRSARRATPLASHTKGTQMTDRTRRIGVAFLILIWTITWGPSAASAQDASETSQEAMDAKKADDTAKGIFGETVGSDFVAKHISLLVGMTVLNPFNFEEVSSSSSSGESGSDNKNKEFNLKTGTTDAQAFFEIGFRYRWAWQDRISVADSLRLEALDELKDKDPAKLSALRAKILAYKEAMSSQQGIEAARATLEADEAYRRLVATSATARARWERGNVTYSPAIAGAIYPNNPKCWLMQMDCPNSENSTRLAALLVPSDWGIRMGYVFNSNNSPDASTLAGASDVYMESLVGWNLARFSMANASPDIAPIRGVVNFEAVGSLATDRNINDVHPRVLLGPSIAFGVPIRFLTGDDKKDDAAAPGEMTRDVDALLSDDVKHDPVVELVARVGAAYVQTPRFLSDQGRMVEVENDTPEFHGGWGVGMDIEMYVPINEKAGYIVTRGSINAGFDPNPWVIQIGWTLPISTVAQYIGILPSSKS